MKKKIDLDKIFPPIKTSTTSASSTQPKESWEEKFDEEFVNGARLGGVYAKIMGDKVKQFIKNLLEVEYERGRHDNIIDISTWKNIGIKRNYFDFLLREPLIKLIKGL